MGVGEGRAGVAALELRVVSPPCPRQMVGGRCWWPPPRYPPWSQGWVRAGGRSLTRARERDGEKDSAKRSKNPRHGGVKFMHTSFYNLARPRTHLPLRAQESAACQPTYTPVTHIPHTARKHRAPARGRKKKNSPSRPTALLPSCLTPTAPPRPRHSRPGQSWRSAWQSMRLSCSRY